MTATLTSKGALRPAAEGTMLAIPLMSVVALLWLTCRITGMEELLEEFSSLAASGNVPLGLSQVVRKPTLAAATELGGTEESVTWTIIG